MGKLFLKKNLIFQNSYHIWNYSITGWGELFVFMTERGKKVTVGSATPAIMMVLVVFALPTRYR